MGQKVNPFSQRTGITVDWSTHFWNSTMRVKKVLQNFCNGFWKT